MIYKVENKNFVKGSYIYDVHTEGWDGVVLKFVASLQILLFLSNKSIVHFLDRGRDVKELAIFLWTSYMYDP